MLRGALLEEPILKYRDPERPYILYINTSKYAWAGVLTLPCQHKEEKGDKEINHLITYISRLFGEPQINWAILIKEAYPIYMSTKKLNYYL